MNEIIILVICVVSLFFLWKFFKPYLLKYDTTILFTGGIGSGKSLSSVKLAVKLYKKNLLKYKIRKFFNKKKYVAIAEPKLFSNMPIKLGKNKYCCCLTKEIITLKERIPQLSVILIDEMTAICTQYNWNNEEVKYHLNEFIQFFRHYIGGYLITNAQAESEIVKQVRSKLNSYYWCFNFQKFLIFYRMRVLHLQVSENEVAINQDFIEKNTKWTYGILTKMYDSRYLKNRYLNIKNLSNNDTFDALQTNNIIRFENYKSRCDDKGVN